MLALKQLVLGRGADLMFFFDDTRHKLIKWSLWILEFMIMSLQVVGLTFSYFWSIIPFYNKVLTFQNAADILLCCVCLSAVKKTNKFWSAFFNLRSCTLPVCLCCCSVLRSAELLISDCWRRTDVTGRVYADFVREGARIKVDTVLYEYIWYTRTAITLW